MKKLISFLFVFSIIFPVSKSNEIVGCQSKKTVKYGSEFCINNENTERNQKYGAIAPIGNERFVVTWQGKDNNGSGIFAQMLKSEDGSKYGDHFQVNSYTTNDQQYPAVTSISSNNERFVITWQSFGQDSDEEYGIFARRFNSDDYCPIEDVEFQVNNVTVNDQEFPAITPIGANNEKFVVAWQGFESDESKYGIFAQLFNSQTGTKNGAYFQVNTMPMFDQKSPAVASVGSNNERFVVTWQGFDLDSDRYNIYARIYKSSDGTPIVNDFQVSNNSENHQESPAIISIGKNNEKFVVTWHSNSTDGSEDEIFARMFDSSDGSPIGNDFSVNNFTGNNQEYPSIASITSGNEENFVITWASNNTDGSVSGIFAQIFNSSNGCKIGNEFQVNTEWKGDQKYPAIASISSGNVEEGRFIIVWTSLDQDGSDNGLFAQMYYSTLVCDCEEGYYSNFTDPDNCIQCSEGQYQNETGQTECLKCSQGSYQNEMGQNECSSCIEGQYQNQTGQTECQLCPPGSYQNETGQIECNKCGVGTFNSDYGSTSIGECTQCSPGKYQDHEGQTECLNCPPGSYQNEIGQSNCHKCGIGTSNPNFGSISIDNCTQCGPGKYQDQKGQAQCLNCPPGSYQNGMGQFNCHKCDIGTFNPDSGSISIDNCTQCGPGKYQDHEGQAKCLNCPPGSYQDDMGKSECQNCPTGTFNPDSGSISIDECTQCGHGKYQDHEGETECLNCPQGSYQDEMGQSECKNCPTGTYNQEVGSEELEDCLKCPVGEYNDQEAQSSCFPCQMGQYSNQKGSTNCTECISGYYNANEMQTTCQSCQPGTYQSASGGINCDSCPFNTWQSNIGSKECEYCPLWSETLSMKTSSINECYCTVGYYGKPGEYCSECPSGGICDTFNQQNPIPKSGYWSSNENPNTLIKCQITEACPGLQIEFCNISLGYTGYQCTECLSGFYKVDYKCEKCPGNANSRLFLIFIVFMLLILFLLFIAKKATAYFGSFTISFSFLQFLAIVYQLNVDWPTNMSTTLHFFHPFDFNLDFLATECVFLLFLITLVDIQYRIKAKSGNNKLDPNSQKQIKLIQILLLKNQKINTLSLIFNWFITLNNKNSKKIFHLFNKINNQINVGDDDDDSEISNDSDADEKDYQINIKKNNYKNNKKMMKLNNSRLKNINLFQDLFNSHILILFLRWYNTQASPIQKIRIKNLLQFFFQYKYIKPWKEQKQEYLLEKKKLQKRLTFIKKKK
ncbi:insulin-like growth factor binding protein [Anaeramoeba flamelloides]|uniref:Insulin-like growth factor binding protein n=1 Tax=Anaeramoeba flamelloides TaxID=1746091 RepID=A0ABQ8Z475_9EUKA|nr:insulin-like growth factor binding protein [Anaeramoeba flamelloides]